MITTPVDPSRETARRWAEQELSDPLYAKARPGIGQRLLDWLLEQLNRLTLHISPTDTRTGLVLAALVVAVVAAVLVARRGRLRGVSRASAERAVFTDQIHDSAHYRRLADSAAAELRWDDAVRERFRAVVRTLQERVVLDERPGRTADEAAREAAATLPELSAALDKAARCFDDVCYGDRPGTLAQHEQIRTLDEAARVARIGRVR